MFGAETCSAASSTSTKPQRNYRGSGFRHPHACCESLAGQKPEAIKHLRQAIDMWDGFREMARHDSDFDAVRDEPAFQALVG